MGLDTGGPAISKQGLPLLPEAFGIGTEPEDWVYNLGLELLLPLGRLVQAFRLFADTLRCEIERGKPSRYESHRTQKRGHGPTEPRHGQRGNARGRGVIDRCEFHRNDQGHSA